MQDPIQQTLPTNPGTSPTFIKGENQKKEILATGIKEDSRLKESINEFIGRVAQAQLENYDGTGAGSIEAAPHIIAHFNRKGLNGAKYFIFQNVKIYPIGQTEEIEAQESVPLEEKLHGKEGGIVDRR